MTTGTRLRALARAALAAACLGRAVTGAAAEIPPLVIYSPHGPEILKAAEAAFKAAIPDAKLDWRFLGAEEVVDKLAKERALPVADVWWGGPQFTFIRGAKAGLLSPYEPSWKAQSQSGFHDEGGLWYGDLQAPITAVYHTNLVKPEDVPKDWDDLLKPALRGRFVVRYPTQSGTMRALYTAFIDRQLSRGRTLDQAFQWLGELEQQVSRYVDHSQVMFSTLGKGLLPFGFWNVPESVMKSRQGYPVEFVFMTSGLPVLLDCIGLVKKPGEHPYARKFYETVTSKEFAVQLTRPPFNRIHVRTDLGSEARPGYLDDKRFKVLPVDWKRVAENEAAWLARWEKDVAAKAKLSH